MYSPTFSDATEIKIVIVITINSHDFMCHMALSSALHFQGS